MSEYSGYVRAAQHGAGRTRHAGSLAQRSRRGWSVLFTASLLVCSCAGGASDDAEFPSAIDEAREKLRGEWKLAEFNVAGGGADVVSQLLGPELRIHFTDDEVYVSGVGNASALPYTLSQATLNGATLHLHTDGGVTYDISGEFVENTVKFRSLTEPWRGSGSLVRP